MSKAKSPAEAKIPMEKEMQAKGRPEKSPLPVKSTLPMGMKAPKESGENSMGSVKKDGHMGHDTMGHAARHLERETERGAHAAQVAGETIHEHSGRHSHK